MRATDKYRGHKQPEMGVRGKQQVGNDGVCLHYHSVLCLIISISEINTTTTFLITKSNKKADHF